MLVWTRARWSSGSKGARRYTLYGVAVYLPTYVLPHLYFGILSNSLFLCMFGFVLPWLTVWNPFRRTVVSVTESQSKRAISRGGMLPYADQDIEMAANLKVCHLTIHFCVNNLYDD